MGFVLLCFLYKHPCVECVAAMSSLLIKNFPETWCQPKEQINFWRYLGLANFDMVRHRKIGPIHCFCLNFLGHCQLYDNIREEYWERNKEGKGKEKSISLHLTVKKAGETKAMITARHSVGNTVKLSQAVIRSNQVQCTHFLNTS